MTKATALLCWGLVVILSLPAVSSGSLVEADIYLAGEHYSEWVFQGSKAKCELKHEIPEFGIGRFLRIAGEELAFRIDSFQPVPIPVEGLLREISPSWEHGKPDPLTQKISLKSGLTPVKMARKPAVWLLSSLANGQIGSIDFLDWDDNRKEVYVQLSPVNYQKPYREFRRCLKNLSPNGFDAYQHSDVLFSLDVYELDASAQQLLRQLADYITANDSIRQVKIDGHADDQGTHKYNDTLSQRRAESVFDYLLATGIKPDLMSRRAFGESQPKINSYSEQARAVNRRVEIRLSR